MRLNLIFVYILTIALTFGTLFSSQAKERRFYVKIYGMDKSITKGVLESVNDKGVYYVKKVGEAPIFFDALQIKQIKVRKKGKSGTGTTIGFVTGLAAGITGVVMTRSEDKLANVTHSVGAVLVTFLTSAIGGSIGSRYDDIILVNGRSEDYLQTLQRLSSFAPAPKN